MDYTWVLNNARSLYDAGMSTSVITTDRELGLISAINTVFPNSYHLLCEWHIKRCVRKNCLKHLSNKADVANGFAFGVWSKLVDSLSVEDFDRRYKEIQWEYRTYPNLLSYLGDTWIVYKERFVKAWTNKVFHLGNTATNRAESNHASLKDWLASSTGAFDTIWKKCNAQLECQFNEIKNKFSLSEKIRKHCTAYPIFQQLNGVISHKGLAIMENERSASLNKGVRSDPSLCACAMRSTHGLPCGCKMMEKEAEMDCFYPDEIHAFWRTLSLEGPDEKGVADREFDAKKKFLGLVMQMEERPDPQWRSAHDVLFAHMYPSLTYLVEPSSQQTRGRPKKDSCARFKSPWERSNKESKKEKRKKESPASTPLKRARGCSKGSTRATPTFEVPYFYDIIYDWLIPCIQSFMDVLGDGNCGYRCVAHALKNDQSKWDVVRNELVLEMQRNTNHYVNMFSTAAVKKIIENLSWWDKTQGAPYEKWMSMQDVGFSISNTYNALVVCYSETSSSTYLHTHFPDGISAVAVEIWILFYRHTSHFIYLRMTDDTPLPPIHPQWFYHRMPSVANLDVVYQDRLHDWRFKVRSEVDCEPRTSAGDIPHELSD